MSSTSDRLDRIEAENADLKAEVARLKAKVEPPPPAAPDYRYGGKPYVQPRASVTVQADPPPPDLTDANLRELRRLVGTQAPGLISKPDGTSEVDALRRFGNALRAVEMLHGTDQMDTEHALSWWVEHAQSIVDRDAGQADFTRNDFTAAALALGVWYRAWTASSPVHFALLTYVPYATSKFTFPLKGQWRETLRRGSILPPNWNAIAPTGGR